MTVELDEVRVGGFGTSTDEAASMRLMGSFTKVRVSFGGLRSGSASSRERCWTDCWSPRACEGLPINQVVSETLSWCNQRCNTRTYENLAMR